MNAIALLSSKSPQNFTLDTIPFGFGKAGDKHPAALTALGDQVVQLEVLATNGLLPGFEESIKTCSSHGGLNPLLWLGRRQLGDLRQQLIQLLQTGSALDEDRNLLAHATHPIDDTRLDLPVIVGDYTDFYASRYHAERVGAMFRGKEKALQPNWFHLPVGYHGRSSSIVVSGTRVQWPWGQLNRENGPEYGPSRKLDFEVEFGCISASGNELGHPVTAEQTDDMIGGFVLVNDWSARDIQAWEYVPLGPFTAKNFATSVSPWIVHPDALEPFRVSGPDPEVAQLPYLQHERLCHFDITLQAWLRPGGSTEEYLVCTTNTRHLYWSMQQMLAHQTVTGCNIRPGDLYASGTVSGPDSGSRACLLELTENGEKPLKPASGIKRTFLQAGDEVIITGKAEKNNIVVNLGEVSGVVVNE